MSVYLFQTQPSPYQTPQQTSYQQQQATYQQQQSAYQQPQQPSYQQQQQSTYQQQQTAFSQQPAYQMPQDKTSLQDGRPISPVPMPSATAPTLDDRTTIRRTSRQLPSDSPAFNFQQVIHFIFFFPACNVQFQILVLQYL